MNAIAGNRIRSAKDVPISSMADWFAHAPPKGLKLHWQDGRSAKETARAWIDALPAMPSEIEDVLKAHPDFGPVFDWRAQPEARLAFDSLRGEPRNTDLLVHAHDGRGQYIVAVEAKADESFGETVAKALEAASKAVIKTPNSQRRRRIDWLLAHVLPCNAPRASVQNTSADLALRYQLLTACAGAVAQAWRENCKRAVMLVQELVSTAKTTPENLQRNAQDLEAFVCRLAGFPLAAPSGTLIGPFTTKVAPEVALYVGKVRREVDA